MIESSKTQVDNQRTLVFRGKLPQQDVVDIQRYRDFLLLGKGLRRVAACLLIGISLLFAIGMFLGKPTVGGIVLLGAWIAWVYGALVYYPMYRLRRVRQHYRSHADSYHESTVTLSPEHMSIDNPSVQSRFDWKRVGVVADTPAGLLFCAADLHVYFWLPQRLLTADARQLVIAWAEQNNVKVRPL
jgi:hypothetical protein